MLSKQPRTNEFEEAALPHLKELYRTAARLLSDRAKAEDVVQETYLQAWKSFHRFESGTNCRAWLYKILINTIHHYRRDRFNLRLVKESEEILEQTAAEPAPLPEHMGEADVLNALASLRPEFRAAVLLADVEEFSYKEVAAILDVPIGTVMSRVSRGRRQLREQLGGVAKSYGIGQAHQESPE